LISTSWLCPCSCFSTKILWNRSESSTNLHLYPFSNWYVK
jgi:hypothetical protein